MEHASRAFYALLALGASALLGWGLLAAGGEGLVFALFAVLTVGGGLVCVWERSVVRSAFALLGVFGGTAGLFVLLGADFLGVAQILIYVGGILALLLFGVMLSPPDLEERKLPRVLSGLFLLGGAAVWVGAKVAATVTWSRAAELPPMKSRAEEIGVAFLSFDRFVVPFELAALVLTVALVAAVYIARRRKEDLREERGGGL